jgi:hypothetical protein
MSNQWKQEKCVTNIGPKDLVCAFLEQVAQLGFESARAVLYTGCQSDGYFKKKRESLTVFRTA